MGGIVELVCLIAGPIIAGLVQLFKNWSFAARHPKIVALVLSVAISVIGAFTFWELDWQALVACTLVPFAGAVASYEVVKDAGKTDVSV